uniref:Uncharacterized protein n=1 Tax=Anolis carolinensis TaxID=28377 RepID=A0A803TZV3_ANOCA
MPTLEPEQLAIREMREEEAPMVLELLKVRWIGGELFQLHLFFLVTSRDFPASCRGLDWMAHEVSSNSTIL